ncbi:MAG: SPOR domain-containing protein, partial [Hyphomicrobiales bacterium]
SSKPLPERDFDVSRMPRAIRPAVTPDHSDLGGLHGQASPDLAAAELPSSEANFQTTAVKVPEPVSEPIVDHVQYAAEPAISAPTVEPAPTASGSDALTAELTRYVDAVGDVQGNSDASLQQAATLQPEPAPVQSAPQMPPVPPQTPEAVVKPASELSMEPMAKPDFSYLREVEDLRVPAANAPVETPAEVAPTPETPEEVYQVQDADILYEEYEDDNGSSLFASRGMMVAAGVVAFVVLGGAALLAYQAIFSGDDSGPPPLVMADKSPVRIMPDGQAADTDGSSDIGSLSEPGTAADGQLVPRAEEPVTNLNPNIDQGRSVRVVDSQGVSPTSDPLGPRPVRTFVVRPDGSIVSNSSTGTAAPASSGGIQPRVVTTQPITGTGAPAPATNTIDSASGIAVPRPRPNAGGTQVSSAQTAAGTSTVGGRAALPVAPRVSVGTNSPAFNPDAPTVQPSNRVPAGNVIPQTTQQAVQPTAPAAATPARSGDFVVQVSSQRSEDAARSAYAGLQRRFPSVLGNQAPDIARADLGSRGVFYRVRVGPMETRQAASNLCQSLKNAGGDCIVARR